MDIPSSLCGLRPTSGRPEAAQAGPASVHINAYIDIYIDGYWDCNRFARCRHEGFHGGEPDAAGPRIVAKGRRSHRWSNAARPVPRGTGWQISRWFLLRRERVRQGSCADRKHEGNGQGHRRNRAAHAKKKRDYSGAAGGARTPDLRLRRPVLYPAELLPRGVAMARNRSGRRILPCCGRLGRMGGIRASAPGRRPILRRCPRAWTPTARSRLPGSG